MQFPQLPDGVTWGSFIGGVAGAAILLRKVLSGDRVDRANNDAQVNIIATLQAERDAAVKRADEAVAARESAMGMITQLQIQIGKLQNQVEQLSGEVAALHQVTTSVAHQ